MYLKWKLLYFLSDIVLNIDLLKFSFSHNKRIVYVHTLFNDHFIDCFSTMEDTWYRRIYPKIWNLSTRRYRDQDQMENHLFLYG